MRKYVKSAIRNLKNGRRESTDKIHSEETAAWAESDKVVPESQVSIPSTESVIDAREWVDDGSKL